MGLPRTDFFKSFPKLSGFDGRPTTPLRLAVVRIAVYSRRHYVIMSAVACTIAVLGFAGVAALSGQSISSTSISGASGTFTSTSSHVTTPPGGGDSSSAKAQVTSNKSSKTEVNVSVNGQSIAVPDNGTTQQVIDTPNGSTSVTVSNNQTSQGDANNTSFSASSYSVMSSTNNFVNAVNVEQQFSSP